MFRIFELKLPFDHNPDQLPAAVASALRVPVSAIECWNIRRQAIDARKKNRILCVYTIDAKVRSGVKVNPEFCTAKIAPAPDESYRQVSSGSEKLRHRPVVAGGGPAGLFAALILARAGYYPILIERGRPIEQRRNDVRSFWDTGVLDPESNAQFGEGGAGAFSDGKLTTAINDPRCKKVLDELISAGAPETIGTAARPHIGTDRLMGVVASLRKTILSLGGEVRFEQKLTDIRCVNNCMHGAEINNSDIIETEVLILTVGHSARDTASALFKAGVCMSPKEFSIGVRIEHPQAVIDSAQYGLCAGNPRLPPADYKMAFHADTGRSAYTFCMCPGGEVIAAASHEGCVVTNGMSYLARNLPNANSALLVNVGPADFENEHPLAGFMFQETLEKAAFEAGGRNYFAPVQCLGDFMQNRPTAQIGRVKPSYRPGIRLYDMFRCLPGYVCETIRLAIPAFGRKLNGFDMPDAVLTGVETRSSSPVRMLRNSDFMSTTVSGLYPAGEGAGYAGGIMSSAVDGIRVAEAVISRYARFEN